LHTDYIHRMVSLEKLDYRIVRQTVGERVLGGKGFSAALRIIIRKWIALTGRSSDSNLPQADLPALRS
jgi:hypothetical protein